MADIFISYRRSDGRWSVQAIHQRLEREFGPRRVFLDTETIEAGDAFADLIRSKVAQCRTLLATIGPGWLNARDIKGIRRLDDPKDLVRVEIGEALRLGKRVIPILVDGAALPAKADLSPDLSLLVERNTFAIRADTFTRDISSLVDALRSFIGMHPGMPVAVGKEPEPRILFPGEGLTEWFRDSDHAPEMVVVPPGTFAMGSDWSEPMREPLKSRYRIEEAPVRQVNIGSFSVGRFAVTRGEFAAFVQETGHECERGANVPKGVVWQYDPNLSWREPGFVQENDHPVVCVSWHDAKAYAAWVCAETKKAYRLLTEAEWEFVARAGTTTPFWFGETVSPQQANYNSDQSYPGIERATPISRTVPVDRFSPNPWGLYQVHGNVWEWCEDPWHDDYANAPGDGSAWLRGGDDEYRVLRGGSWHHAPWHLRSANRFRNGLDQRLVTQGFRIARDL